MMIHSHETLRSRSYDLYGGMLGFSEWCGLRYIQSSAEDTRMALPWSERVADAQGVIGPGMLATLVDSVGGQVAVAKFDWQVQIATISLSLNLIAPVRPGQGLIGEGKTVAAHNDTVLVDIRILGDGPAPVLVASGGLRVIAVARIAPPDRPGIYAALPVRSRGPFFGPDDAALHFEDGRAVARIAPKAHFLGNEMRGALHGGFVAAALFETAAALGRTASPAFTPMGGVVDFLLSAREAEMTVGAELVRTGRRVGFAEAVMEQVSPAHRPRIVARLAATLQR